MNAHNEVLIVHGRSGSGKEFVSQIAGAAGFAPYGGGQLLHMYGSNHIRQLMRDLPMVPDQEALPILVKALDTLPVGDVLLNGVIRNRRQHNTLMPVLKKAGYGRIRVLDVQLSLEEAMKRLLESRKRKKDTREKIMERHRYFDVHTAPLIELFKREMEVHEVLNSLTKEEVSARVLSILCGKNIEHYTAVA